jgi:RND superfamily putative drug exporter
MVAGFALSAQTVHNLKTDFSVPGQPGFDTAAKINKALKPSDSGPSIPVITVPMGETVDQRKSDIAAVWDKVRKDNPQLRITDWVSSGNDNLVTKDRRSTFALVYAPQPKSFSELPAGISVPKAFAPPPGQVASADALKVGGTGYLELSLADAQKGGHKSGGPGLVLELAFGAGGALLVLAFVFASFLALLPLVVALVSIPVTFAALLPLTYAFNMSVVLQFLVIFIGLGVAIDYSLLLVTRWREERDHGRENEEAVRIAVAQAGHSVVFSAVAVGIGLLSLTVLPVPFLRSLGLGGMFIPLVSTLVTITLTPAILASVGPRIDRPRIRKEATASRAWTWWAGGVVKHPRIALVAALALLGVLAAPAFGMKLGLAEVDSLAKSGPIVTQYQALRDGGVPQGVLTPMEVLTHGDPQAVVNATSKIDGVAFAFAPTKAEGFRTATVSVVEVIPTTATVNSSNTGIVAAVRHAVESLPGVVGVAGAGPVQRDYATGVYAKFPFVLIFLAVLTFLALTRAFRSVVLAIKAVVLNLVSLAATFGAMTFIWQEGHGSNAIFDTASTGSIIFWVPIMIFAFLYGLSMDYEVFILTRVREEYDAGGNTNEALIEGLGRTGRLVTSAALILFLAFVSLAAQPGTDIKVLASGLGIGILLDATIIRALLVPALVVLFGKWNWYLPDRLAKILHIRPSHPIGTRVPAPV